VSHESLDQSADSFWPLTRTTWSLLLYADSGYGMVMSSLDAALISFGPPTPFPTPRAAPDVSQGMAFCLYDNIWGTNYIVRLRLIALLV